MVLEKMIERKLAASILAADFTRLGQEITQVDHAGADMIHIDVMDGDFVPSISFGMPLIRSIRKATGKMFDVHLMVTEPGRFIDEFAECGANMITVHVEACKHIGRVIRQIKEKGCKAGVALNPATPLENLNYIIRQVDMVLIMTVNPGFGGQDYIEECTKKIRSLRSWLDGMGLTTDIQVDGGITLSNVKEILEAGANVIVAGTSIFKGDTEKNTAEFQHIFSEQESI